MMYDQQLQWVINAVLAGYYADEVPGRAEQSVRDMVRSVRHPKMPMPGDDWPMEDFELQLYQVCHLYNVYDLSPTSVSTKIRRYTAGYFHSVPHDRIFIREYNTLATMRNSMVLWSHNLNDVSALFDHLESVHGVPHEDQSRYFPIILDMALSLYETAHAVHFEDDVPWAWRSPILYAAWKERFRVRDGVETYLAPVYDVSRQQAQWNRDHQ